MSHLFAAQKISLVSLALLLVSPAIGRAAAPSISAVAPVDLYFNVSSPGDDQFGYRIVATGSPTAFEATGLANGEPEILERALEPAPAPGVAGALLQAAGVAEFFLRGEAGLGFGQTVGGQIRGALLEVKTHFLRHLGLRAIAAKQKTKTAGESAQRVHGAGWGRRFLMSPAAPSP